MFKRILEFFFGKKETQAEPVVPYKLEPQETTIVVDASLDTKPTVAEAPVKKARKPRANVAAKKIATAKKTAAKKPAAPKDPTA